MQGERCFMLPTYAVINADEKMRNMHVAYMDVFPDEALELL